MATETLEDQKKPSTCPASLIPYETKSVIPLQIKLELEHVKLKPFKCLVCAKAYTQKAHLNEHNNRVHENKRPHKCSSCKSTFQHKYAAISKLCTKSWDLLNAIHAHQPLEQRAN